MFHKEYLLKECEFAGSAIQENACWNLMGNALILDNLLVGFSVISVLLLLIFVNLQGKSDKDNSE